MKTKVLQLLFIVLLALAGFNSVTAQNCSGNAPVTIAPSMTATAGTIVVPIKIGGSDFVNINAISLKVKYDKNVLTFVSINAPNKPSGWSQPQEAGAVITGNTAELGISHTGPSDSGWGLTDGQILYNITFTFHGGSTSLAWDYENENCQYATASQVDGNGPGLYLCQALRNYVNGFICDLPAPTVTCPPAITLGSNPVDGYSADIQEIHCAVPPTSASGYWVDNGPWVWQSFHPGKTGVLKSVSLGVWNINILPFTLHIALYPGEGVCASATPGIPSLWSYDTTFTSPVGPISGAVSGVFTFNIPESARPYMVAGQLYNFSFSGIHSYVEDNPNDYNHGWYVSSPVCGGAGSADPMPGGGTYGFLPVGPTWSTGCVTTYHIAFNTVIGNIPDKVVNWINYSNDIQEIHCATPPTSAGGYWVDNGPWVWQSFHPGKTGVLKSVSLGLWNINVLPFTVHVALYPGDGICATAASGTAALWTYDTTFTSPTGPLSGAVSGIFTFNVPEADRPYLTAGQLYNFSFSGIHSYVTDNPNDFTHGWYVSSPSCGGAGTNDPMPGGGTYGYLPAGTWASGCVDNYHVAFNTAMGEIPGLVVGAANSCGVKILTSNPPSGHAFPIGTTNVVYTITNLAGASSTCSFPVTIAMKRALHLSLLLEGLYNGNGTMFKAQGLSGDQFQGDTADVITVELHNPIKYLNPPEYTEHNVKLSTNGSANVSVQLSGSYYVTIKHRNSIETTSALPVSFSDATINYAFDAFSKAYNNNMTFVIEADGITQSPPLIYGGDINQDGWVEGEDLNAVGNDAAAFAVGYIPSDVFADGQVEGFDINIVANNAAQFVDADYPE